MVCAILKSSNTRISEHVEFLKETHLNLDQSQIYILYHNRTKKIQNRSQVISKWAVMALGSWPPQPWFPPIHYQWNTRPPLACWSKVLKILLLIKPVCQQSIREISGGEGWISSSYLPYPVYQNYPLVMDHINRWLTHNCWFAISCVFYESECIPVGFCPVNVPAFDMRLSKVP